MDIDKIKDMMIRHEGLRLTPYRCTVNKLTLGVGRNIEDVGITKEEALFLLNNDINLCVTDLWDIFNEIDEFSEIPENIQMVLVNMRFQLGPSRFRKFKKMIAAVKESNWPEMIIQMKDSRWYKQTTNRANDLISMVRKVKV